MKNNYLILAASLLLISCGNKQVKNSDNENAPIGGSDAAMGYTYSKVLDKKIRIFEEGARLLSAVDPQATMAAFAVFPSDSSKVELFLPKKLLYWKNAFVLTALPYGMWKTMIPICLKNAMMNGLYHEGERCYMLLPDVKTYSRPSS